MDSAAQSPLLIGHVRKTSRLNAFQPTGGFLDRGQSLYGTVAFVAACGSRFPSRSHTLESPTSLHSHERVDVGHGVPTRLKSWK